MLYRAYGRFLESDKPLPELEPVSIPRADFRIVWDAIVRAPRDARWTTLWRFSDGEPWVSVARTPNSRYLRFGRFADVRVSDGLIEIAPRERVTDATLRHLLLDQALPLALAARGALVAHASAISIGGHAVLLLGEAGAGKSTLAALLARDGCPVLADDGVLLEESAGRLRAVPSYPGLRLFADSCVAAEVDGSDVEVAEYTPKRRVLPGAHAGLFRSSSAPVGRIYTLAPGGDLAIERLSRRDATIEIIKHVYRADVDEPLSLEAQLDAIARSSAALNVWRLAYPRDLAKGPEVARAIADHAGAHMTGTADAAQD